MKVGDRVKITKGAHKGKSGTIASTRGSNISGFVMVQIERLTQGCRYSSSGPVYPSDRVGVLISNIEHVHESR